MSKLVGGWCTEGCWRSGDVATVTWCTEGCWRSGDVATVTRCAGGLWRSGDVATVRSAGGLWRSGDVATEWVTTAGGSAGGVAVGGGEMEEVNLLDSLAGRAL